MIRTLHGRPYHVPSARRPSVEALEDRLALSATAVRPVATFPPGLSPENVTALNGSLYFVAADTGVARQLWKTDGTPAGTQLVKDFTAGTAPARPTTSVDPASPLAVLGGALYFVADDGAHGAELWKSDGSDAGTVLVKDINPGSVGSMPSDLTVVNDTLYFAAADGAHGTELWQSDGSDAGTVLVKDVFAGQASGVPNGSYPHQLVNFNGTLTFTATDGGSGAELWQSDGSDAGTVLVKDAAPGTPPFGPVVLDQLTPVGNSLYFAATSAGGAPQLWKTDGTAGNTVLVMDFGVGASTWPLTELTPVDGTLFFSAGTPAAGQELWKSDGTPQGTVLVKDIVAIPPPVGPNGDGFPHGSYPHALTAVGGKLSFLAATPDGSHEALWTSDGTAAGTRLVKNLPGDAFAYTPSVPKMEQVGGNLYFVAGDGQGGAGLWRSNGTSAGTVLVTAAGQGPVSVDDVATQNGVVYFAGGDGAHRQELWQFDATAGSPPTTGGTPPGPGTPQAPPPPVTSSTSSDQAWLNRVYFDLLGRAADAGGTTYWTGLLQRGAGRVAVVEGIESSAEHDARLVRAMYQRYLHRDADEGGLQYFVGLLQGGAPVEDAQASLLGSPEYLQKHGANDPSFVSALFQETLGAEPDAATRASVGTLVANADRAQAAKTLLQGADYRRHLVQSYYGDFLRRGADEGGTDYFANLLATGRRDQDVRADLLASDEYYRRS